MKKYPETPIRHAPKGLCPISSHPTGDSASNRRVSTRVYDVIVVGAGISGLLSALALSKEGNSVLVLEKTKFIGGNCRTYEVNDTGYFVDSGVHAVTCLKNGPLVTLMNKYFSIVPKFVPHGHYYVRDEKSLKKFPNTFQDLVRFSFLPRKEKLILSKLVIEAMARMSQLKKTDVSVYDYVQKYAFSEHTLRFLDAVSYFLSGVSMKETPVWRIITGGGLIEENEHRLHKKITNIARIAINSTYEEQGYPRGGIGNLVHCILHSASKNMKVQTSEKVIKIRRTGKSFVVQTSKESYTSGMVVYSAEAKKLAEVADMPAKWAASAKKIRQSKSITLWLGLKKPLKSFSYKGSEVWFRSGVSYWAMPVSNYDSCLTPKGKQLVGFSTFMPYEEDAAAYEKKLLETIYSAIPEVKGNIEMKHVQIMVPEKGAVSVGVKFPPVNTPIKNLYLVGTDADMRSMGITRASYSVVEMLKIYNSKKTKTRKTKNTSQSRYQRELLQPLADIRQRLPASMARVRQGLRQ